MRRLLMVQLLLLNFCMVTSGQEWVGGGREAPELPPEDLRVVHGTTGLAQGKLEAFVVKGGPAGIYIWGHLHGRHPERFGETSYKNCFFIIRDKKTHFQYVISPVISRDVANDGATPDRNKHWTIQMLIKDEEMKAWFTEAVNNHPESIEIVCRAERNLNNGPWLAEKLKPVLEKYLTGNIDLNQFLQESNKGLKPSFFD